MICLCNLISRVSFRNPNEDGGVYYRDIRAYDYQTSWNKCYSSLADPLDHVFSFI